MSVAYASVGQAIEIFYFHDYISTQQWDSEHFF